MGKSIEVKYSYRQEGSAGIVFIFGKDPRTLWQKIKDWYAVKVKKEVRPVYVDPEYFIHPLQWRTK